MAAIVLGDALADGVPLDLDRFDHLLTQRTILFENNDFGQAIG
ncbi:hypothetical protein [Mycobacterium intermedium]|nr:hypothetical protein [Mycobacterium intermedium]